MASSTIIIIFAAGSSNRFINRMAAYQVFIQEDHHPQGNTERIEPALRHYKDSYQQAPEDEIVNPRAANAGSSIKATVAENYQTMEYQRPDE
jgi:hypothetical protein